MAGDRTEGRAALEAGRLMRLKRLFELALDAPEADWENLVARECAGELELAAQLTALLEAHKRQDAMLDRSIPERLLEAATAAAEASLRGVELNGRYLLECEVGRGGFGTVYLAQDSRMLGRQVAVKVLHRQAGADLALETELAALAPLHHPSIATPFDSGRTPDGRRFLVLDYVAGPSLRKVLCEGAMSPASVARLALALGAALRAAHAYSVWHLDLKPENILIREGEPGEDSPVIVDFGIARIGVTQSGGRLGSPCYAAPEQTAGAPVEASDQYSLALILMEALTGRRAAMPREAMAVTIDPALPAAAAQVLAKALDPDPSRRYPTIAGFTTRFADALRPRRRKLAGWALSAAAVLAVAITIAAWISSREQRIESAAEVDVFSTQLGAQVHVGNSTAMSQEVTEGRIGNIVQALQVRYDRGAREESLLDALAKGLVEMGMIHGHPGRRTLGRSDVGIGYLRRAIQIRDELAAQHPQHLRHFLIGCESRNALASVLVEMGRYRDAEAVVQDALMRLNAIERRPVNGSERLLVEAQRAPLLLTLSRMPFHERRFEECLRLRNRGVEAIRLLCLMADMAYPPIEGGSLGQSSHLAGALAARGYLLREMGRYNEALADYTESNRMVESVRETMPHDFGMRWQRLRNELEVGRTYLAMGNAAKAASTLAGAAAGMRELLAGSGEDVNGVRALSMTLSAQAVARGRLRASAGEVRRLIEEALRLNATAAALDPHNAKVLDERALILRQAAESGAALK